MYKIVACDLDETLIRLDRTISRENIEAIKALKRAGVMFVPATGRGYGSVDVTLRELGLYDEEGQYVISFNGGVITENKNHRVVHYQGIPFDIADELYRRGIAYGECVHVYTRDMVYIYNLVQEEIDYLAGRMEVKEVDEPSLDFLHGQDIIKCLYMNTDRQRLESIADDLRDITADIEVSYSSNRYIEFNAVGVSKGEGLRRLAGLLGVEMRDTVAIGDNFNDLSMIRAAGLGVGVRNTPEDMKPLCGAITEGTCDESAVAEVIYKYLLK